MKAVVIDALGPLENMRYEAHRSPAYLRSADI